MDPGAHPAEKRKRKRGKEKGKAIFCSCSGMDRRWGVCTLSSRGPGPGSTGRARTEAPALPDWARPHQKAALFPRGLEAKAPVVPVSRRHDCRASAREQFYAVSPYLKSHCSCCQGPTMHFSFIPPRGGAEGAGHQAQAAQNQPRLFCRRQNGTRAPPQLFAAKYIKQSNQEPDLTTNTCRGMFGVRLYSGSFLPRGERGVVTMSRRNCG